MKNVAVIPLRKEIEADREISRRIKEFECPLNSEVEEFLRKKALQSGLLFASVTYLVLDSSSCELLGYFTLMQKPYTVAEKVLSSANRRMVRRFSDLNCGNGNYTASVFLIAQIGKNYAIEEEKRISGAELLELAFAKLRAVQSLIGGKLVLIERDASRTKLLDFYQANGFKSWSSRHSESDGIDYDQMLCVLSAPASGRAA